MVGFIFECFLHSRFGLHTVFGCQRSCGLYDLSDSFVLKASESSQGLLWRLGDSNPRPMPCKGTALPAELNPLILVAVGLSGLEPETSPLSEARSNQLS